LPRLLLPAGVPHFFNNYAIFELVVVIIWAHAMCPYGLLCWRDVKNVFRRGTLHVPAVRVGVSTRCEKYTQKILAENIQKKQAFYNSFVGAHCMCPFVKKPSTYEVVVARPVFPIFLTIMRFLNWWLLLFGHMQCAPTGYCVGAM